MSEPVHDLTETTSFGAPSAPPPESKFERVRIYCIHIKPLGEKKFKIVNHFNPESYVYARGFNSKRYIIKPMTEFSLENIRLTGTDYTQNNAQDRLDFFLVELNNNNLIELKEEYKKLKVNF